MTLHKYLIRNIYVRNCTVYTPVLLRQYVTKATKHPTARIIVIGDEILKAQVKDTNSYYMCNLLYKCGIRVKKISIISDDVEEISKEIKNARDKYTYVITCGGIGPTHDDVTYEGLAKAFGDTLHYHPKLVDIIKNKFNIIDTSSPAYKMAQIPRKASLKFGLNPNTGEPSAYPYIALENVYVFPGSPVFFERIFQSLYKDLLSTNRRFVKEELFINTTEETYANALSTVAKEFPSVSFGSYPVSNCRYFKTFITIESDNESDTGKAKRRFRELSPADIFVSYDRTPHVDCVTKYNDFLRNRARRSVYERTLEELRRLYRNPEYVSIRIDGGVESSIVVHLAHICRAQSRSGGKPQAIYFKQKEAALETEEFIKEMVDKYNLAVSTVDATSEGMTKLSSSVQSHLRTLLIGRVGKEIDHNSCATSNVSGLQIDNPLRDWTDEDAWTFASSLCLPYSSELSEEKWERVRSNTRDALALTHTQT
ncbi:FAD synthase isoform X1 [Ooceraea biroi]|uniref:FAD synthase isoform X1 n=2 Tax=Ooceraea biroi TaxID=2015173 RepID=UPI000F080A47|nr:FAD synthase isoform X1 [Ooceraea biroi]